MKIRVASGAPLKHGCRALVVACREGELQGPWLAELDRALDGGLTRLLKDREFTGKRNTSKLLHTWGRLPADRLLLVGVGKERQMTAEVVRQAAGTAAQALKGAGIDSCSSLLHELLADEEQGGEAAATGFVLGGYSFDEYKTERSDLKRLAEVTFLCSTGKGKAAVNRGAESGQAVCRGVVLARNMVSGPGNAVTPGYLAEQGMELAARHGLSCLVLERAEIEELGMGGLAAVGKGSKHGPRFIILEYQGAPADQRPVVIVGKGITFDSGGISLKPRDGMEAMKDDMAGGAAVMGTIQAAAELRLPCNLIGLVPAAENLPDGGAYKPGDVIRTMAGKTVEITNTDAEGRMVLCDALHYAQRYRPAALIDLATLTGACLVALGHEATGLMGSDEGLKRALKRAGEASGERLWELPLWEEYGELMKSDIADLKNAHGPTAGTITAGWFLKQFAGKSRWVHLDIAGTAWEEKGRHYLPKGATGVGVRLLVEYLRDLAR